MRWFKIPKAQDPAKQFIGKHIVAYPTAKDAWFRSNGKRIEVERIAGNMTHQTMFEINGEFLVSMLDAYCELNGQPLPNMEMHEGFLSTVATHITPDKNPDSISNIKRPVILDA